MFFKRLLDIVLASAVLLFMLPILLVVTAAVKLSSPGPIFYTSERLGQNQTRFGMYKFRTMVHNADQLRSGLRADNDQHHELFKLEDDS